MEYFATYDSPLGVLLLCSDGEHLTGLYLNKEIPGKQENLPVFEQAKSWLDGYFAGVVRPMDIPIKAKGTVFQELVWNRLLEIPIGEICTYGQIAREIALAVGKEKMSAQAVGQAVGKNPVSILIPCHRVVGAKGQLTGYGGGMENKIWLLKHEGWQIRQEICSK